MIEVLIQALQAEGGTLGELVMRPTGDRILEPGPPQIAAAGPRAEGHRAEYELLLEMIYEGSLLHYGAARVVHTDDPDLALLLGDQLYALGLARLAALGDLYAVDVLADVISSLAQAHAEGAPDRAAEIWHDGARAIGWGSQPETVGARQLDIVTVVAMLTLACRALFNSAPAAH